MDIITHLLAFSIKFLCLQGRTCFVCLQTNFGVLHWSHTCCVCLKYVCRHCCSNIKIAAQDKKDVTVALLLPHLNTEQHALPLTSPSNFIR